MKKIRNLSIFACALATGSIANAQEKVTYQDHVMPILENACLNCHNPDEAKGGLDLSSFGAMMSGGSGGAVAEPGNPEGSRIYTLMAHIEEPYMPPMKPKSDDKTLAVIKNWIAGGMLDTKDSVAKKSDKPQVDMTVEVGSGKPAVVAMPSPHLLLEPEVVTERGSAITAIATSPWAPLVAIGGQKQVILYNSDNFDMVGIFAFPEGFPQALSFSRNGSLLLAGGGRGGKSGKAVAWDVNTGERVIEVGREFDTALAADISPSQGLVTLGGPGRNIKIFDTRTGEQLHSIKKHPDWLMEVEYSPDGVLFVSGGRTGGLFVWEAESGIEFYDLKEHQKAITGISWRGDSNVVAACSEDGQVSLWEMQNGKQIKKWAAHGGGALAVHFSPDGSKIVSCGRDNRVKIWDINGALQKEITGFTDVVTAVTFTHDSKKVISGDWTGSLKVWDAATGGELGQLQSNPPTIADQIELSKKRTADLIASAAGLEAAIKAAADATAAGQKAVADQQAALANDQKNRAAADAAAKAGDAKFAAATAEVNKAKASIDGKKAAMAKRAEELVALAAQRVAALAELQKWEAEMQVRAEVTGKAMGTVENFKLQVAQLPDDASLKAALADAEKAKIAAEATVAEADQKRKAAGGQIPGIDQKVAQIKQTDAMEATALKAAELVFNEANKLLAEAKTAADASKVALANADKAIENRNAAVKAATDAIAPKVAAEATAKANAEKAKQDLVFVQYQVDKWAAAAVNLELHAESGELENYRERLIDFEGKAKQAIAEHQAAEQARVAAEQTLAAARKTVTDGSNYLVAATEDVLASREKQIAARALEELIENQGKEPVIQVEVAAVETIQADASQHQKVIEEAYQKAIETDKAVKQALDVARETPAVVAERAQAEAARKAAMEQAVAAKQKQEQELQNQTKRVEDLEKEYKEKFRPAPGSEPAAAEPAPAPAPAAAAAPAAAPAPPK